MTYFLIAKLQLPYKWNSSENWYYRVLIVMTGNLENAKIAVDALSICMNINGWELMIPLGFFAGTGVRVANELGAGNGKGAKFATAIAVTQSIVIGLFFWILIIYFHNELAIIFSTSQPVLEAVHKLSILLAFTVLLKGVFCLGSGSKRDSRAEFRSPDFVSLDFGGLGLRGSGG